MKLSMNIGQSVLAVLAVVVGVSVVGCDKSNNAKSGTVVAPPKSDSNPAAPSKPDNTAANKDHDVTKSPLDQGQNATDIKITADIRKAIMDDKAMSMNAQNCKVITDKGIVTLRGVVDTQSEKESIEAKSKAATGVVRVDNQLEVKAK